MAFYSENTKKHIIKAEEDEEHCTNNNISRFYKKK